MEKVAELSIFFPFWNEEKSIDEVTRRALAVAENVAEKWEIILVDDGSSDTTLEKAKNLARKHRNVRVITHSPNRGYGAEIKEGLTAAKYKLVVFTDGDLQFDFSEVSRLLEKIKGADMVIGYRQKRRDNFIRHILMNMLKAWDYLFFGINFKDIDCGFKLLKKSAIEQILPLRSEGAMITTEILVKASRKKLKIEQVMVSHLPRTEGDQSGGNLPVVIRAVLESFILWWDIRNKRI